MGLDWRYVYVVPVSCAEALFDAVSPHVEGAMRRSTPQSWPRDLVFSFPTNPTDHALTEWAEANPKLKSAGGQVRVGCVVPRLERGTRLAILTLVPASSDMSKLFAYSSSVLDVMTRIAAQGGAAAMFLDIEDDEVWSLCYPPRADQRQVKRPSMRAPKGREEADAYGREALTLAGLEVPEEGSARI